MDPSFGMQYSEYAKGWYAVHQNPFTRGMNKKYHVTAIANVHARIAGNKVIF